MELNLSLVEEALEYRRTNRGTSAYPYVRAFFGQGGWIDIPDDRANLAYLFRVLVAVEDAEFGKYQLRIRASAVMSYYWDIYRFGFNNGYIPVFVADTAFCDYVVVPTMEDGVLMSAFLCTLDPPVTSDEFDRPMTGGGGMTIF